jgi:hypothetical protein
MPRTKLPPGSVPVTFRLPRQIHKLLAAKARRAEQSLTEFIRHALRREVGAAGARGRHGRSCCPDAFEVAENGNRTAQKTAIKR